MDQSAETHLAHFDVHPSVVFKLGEDLITDDVQAIAELVKNSYDADATWAVVRIKTLDESTDHPGEIGSVEVEDNGSGMDVEALKRGWLLISNSPKRVMKDQGQKTPRGRTPLGDKGLGRLGAQRLGNRLTIITTPAPGGISHELAFDWREFNNFEALSQFTVKIESKSTKRKCGTAVLISDLREPDRLADGIRLQLELSKVISPYHGIEKFKLAATLNDQPLDLAELDTKVRNAASARYELGFDGRQLHVQGRMRLLNLRPNNRRDRADFERTCEADGGSALFEYLSRLPKARDFALRRSSRPQWWVEFERTIDIEDVRPHLLDSKVASPGPFHGEVDFFNLNPATIQELGVLGPLSDMRRYISKLAGIRIYRDGFNIRVDEDWLALGQRWSTGKSWYGLRPATTMGYLALSAAENSQLVETTDREGFKRTPHYENFENLLGAFVEWTGEIHEFLGRGAVAYREAVKAGPDADVDTETLVERLSDTMRRADAYREPLGEIRARLVSDSAEADELLERVGNLNEAPDDDTLELVSSLNALSRHASRAAEVVEDLEKFVNELSVQQRAGTQLQSEMDVLREQLTLAYETVAVGLTAEALSHEIANIAERLARRTTDIARHIRRSHPADRQLVNFVEHVRGSVAGLRRQLAHLAPSLRYVRERRERLQISAILAEVKEYFDARWKGTPLFLQVQVNEDSPLLINRGKILQIFDNLLLNSEYWLNEDIRLGHLSEGLVWVEVEGRVVRVGDNGPGVHKDVESSLFEPFVTRKPRGTGRGLGLFIIRQLLTAEGCDIQLASVRNKRGRRYVFELELSGAVADG